MLEVDLRVQQRRNLLYRGYGTRVEAVLRKKSTTHRTVPIGEFFSRLLQYAPNLLVQLRQAEVTNEDGKVVCLVQDVRGRPTESFHSGAKKEKPKNSEELFFSTGVLYQPPANLEDYPDDVEELQQQEFSVAVNTAFHSFTPENQIRYRVETEQSDVLSRSLGEVDLHLLARLFPAELHEIRIGLEYFKQRKATMLAGILPPSVKSRFFLEITSESVYLLLEDESGGLKGKLPEFEGNFLKALDRALDELDLYVGLGEQVAQQL